MQNVPEDIEDLNKRIEELKNKQNKNLEQTHYSKVFLGFQLGVEFASGPIVGAAIGYMLDDLFDTKSIIMLTLTVFGGFAGVLNAYRYVKNLDKLDEERNI